VDFVGLPDRTAPAEVIMVRALTPGAALPALEPTVFRQSNVF
jgi:hypothetical protein